MPKQKICGVYAIVYTKNGKVYIGSSIDIKRRWGSHLSALRRKDHCNKQLSNIYNKHGESVLAFSILSKTQPENRKNVEQKWIDKIDRTKLLNGALVVRDTEKDARKPIKKSEGYGLLVSRRLGGRRVIGINLESGETQSWAYLSKVIQDGFGNKVSEVLKGRARSCHNWFFWYEGETPNIPERWGIGSDRKKEVVSINLNTKIQTTYGSAYEASQVDRVSTRDIWKVLKGELLSASNHFYFYSSNPKPIPSKWGRKLRSIPVIATDEETGEQQRFASISEAGRNGYSASTIQSVLKGKIKSYKGKSWGESR